MQLICMRKKSSSLIGVNIIDCGFLLVKCSKFKIASEENNTSQKQKEEAELSL